MEEKTLTEKDKSKIIDLAIRPVRQAFMNY